MDAPATTCFRCHRPWSDDVQPTDPGDRFSSCEECDRQQIEEDALDTSTELVEALLAEALDEYRDGRDAALESASTTEQVAVLREALRLLRSVMEPAEVVACKVCGKPIDSHAEGTVGGVGAREHLLCCRVDSAAFWSDARRDHEQNVAQAADAVH